MSAILLETKSVNIRKLRFLLFALLVSLTLPLMAVSSINGLLKGFSHCHFFDIDTYSGICENL